MINTCAVGRKRRKREEKQTEREKDRRGKGKKGEGSERGARDESECKWEHAGI